MPRLRLYSSSALRVNCIAPIWVGLLPLRLRPRKAGRKSSELFDASEGHTQA